MNSLISIISELRLTLARVETVLGTINEAIVWADRDGRIFWCNSAFDQLVKQPRILNLGSFIYDSLPLLDSDLVSPCDRHPVFVALTASPGIKTYGLKQGDQMTVIEISWASFQPDQSESHQDLSVVLVIRDITDRYQAEVALKQANLRLEERVQQRTAELQTMIFEDTLTRLPSRTALLQKITDQVERNNLPFALVYLDCDQFKLVNGSFGYAVGNQLLIAIGDRLQQHLRPGDLLARMGEDEFCFFLSSLMEGEALFAWVEAVRQSFRLPFKVANFELFMTVSIGVTQGDQSCQNPEEFLQNADIAMYRAKQKERGSYQIFDHQMRQAMIDHLTLENNLQKAIKQQEFVNFYQPIIDLNTQRLAGFEALVRWQHSQWGLVPPGQFIPALETSGLIIPVGLLVFQMACLQLAQWHDWGWTDLTMSINLSARQFVSPTLLADIDWVLGETKVNPACIKLEITESAIMESADTAIALTEKARDRGLQISIDDFGTGYSSLGYLHRFAVDNLKIDRSFVNTLQANKRNDSVVNMIIALAKELKLSVIAEGIETQNQLKRLQHLGCEYGQGYLFAKPLTPHDIEKQWLNANV